MKIFDVYEYITYLCIATLRHFPVEFSIRNIST